MLDKESIRSRVVGPGVAGCRMWQKGMAGRAGRKFPVPLPLPEEDSRILNENLSLKKK